MPTPQNPPTLAIAAERLSPYLSLLHPETPAAAPPAKLAPVLRLLQDPDRRTRSRAALVERHGPAVALLERHFQEHLEACGFVNHRQADQSHAGGPAPEADLLAHTHRTVVTTIVIPVAVVVAGGPIFQPELGD